MNDPSPLAALHHALLAGPPDFAWVVAYGRDDAVRDLWHAERDPRVLVAIAAHAGVRRDLVVVLHRCVEGALGGGVSIAAHRALDARLRGEATNLEGAIAATFASKPYGRLWMAAVSNARAAQSRHRHHRAEYAWWSVDYVLESVEVDVVLSVVRRGLRAPRFAALCASAP